MSGNATLLLFDGHSLAHRAYHGTTHTILSSSTGQPTGMLVGFLNSFFRIYRDEEPDKVVVCFDLPEPTFRHKQFADYKAGRPPKPGEFISQLKLLNEILEALGVPVISKGGFEADDLLATLARLGEQEKKDVVVVTGDRDCLQMVSDPYVKILYTPTRGKNHILDVNGVKEKIGVAPDAYLEYAALKGDPSDNLGGVPGVGEKTAVVLIDNFGNIDGIYKELEKDNPSSLLKPKVKESLAENKDIVERNLELMKLKTDVKLGVKLADLQLGEKINADEVNRLFSELELTKFNDDLAKIFGHKVEVEEAPPSLDTEVEELKDFALAEMLKPLKAGTNLAIAGSWNSNSGEFEGLSIAFEKTSAIWIPKKQISTIGKKLKELLSKANIIVYDAKPIMLVLIEYGINGTDLNLELDASIAHYLISPQERWTTISDLAMRYGRVNLDLIENSEDIQLELTEENPQGTSPQEAVALLLIYKKLNMELKQRQEVTLYKEIELPLVWVLAKMEHIGIAVDKEELTKLKNKLQRESIKYREAIIAAANKEFNVNSPRELGEVLFEDLGLPPQKRIKTGYSTDISTLEKLKGTHEIIGHIMDYRATEKLRSTYGEGLLKEIKADNRIHATFTQTVARTGRLSSIAPNLHNIPIRTEQGREFRKIFIARKGCELLVADYNQIELRCVAHLSQDANLVEAFRKGVDIHASVAERVFGDRSKERREQAKMISYGLIYGMEAYGLADRLNIGKKEAQEILTSFFMAYPSLKEYMHKSVEIAKQQGYTETLFGRRRYIPDLASDDPKIRAVAKRQAMNSGIQGLAADIFKYALIKINDELEAKKLKSQLVLQVHDEVILEVPTAEKSVVSEIVHTQMGNAAELDVPLEVEMTYGKNWNDAKS